MRADLKLAIAFLACASVALASAEAVRSQRRYAIVQTDLSTLAPARVGEWRLIGAAVDTVAAAPEELIGDSGKQYDQIVARTYQDSKGAQIVLMLAYKSRQEQENKVHRPEICYVAQGYQLRDARLGQTDIGGRPVNLSFFRGQSIRRTEDVAYWIRSGSETVGNGWGLRLSIVRAAFHGEIPDGLLVRASIGGAPDADLGENRARLVSFLNTLVSAEPAGGRRALVGSA